MTEQEWLVRAEPRQMLKVGLRGIVSKSRKAAPARACGCALVQGVGERGFLPWLIAVVTPPVYSSSWLFAPPVIVSHTPLAE